MFDSMEKKSFTRNEKIEFAQRMAKNPTPAEAVLYSALSTARIRFKKQYLVSGYILDAYLPDLKIGIECDGGYHNSFSQRIYDIDRDKAILKAGIRVVRFKNEEIMENPMGVISRFRKREGYRQRRRPQKKLKQERKKKCRLSSDDIKAAALSMIPEYEIMSKMSSSEFAKFRGITGSTRIKK
jgi:very-short-patch-repair endonuclease